MIDVVIFEAATKNQTWSLYSCFIRNIKISKTEATQLITDFNKGKKDLP